MRHRILLVDDEVRSLELMERTLVRKYEVHKASNGEAALLLLSEMDFSVIITDQRMPEMTGVEFLAKTIDTHPDLIRIIITAYTDIDALIKAINDGQVYYYLTKPWDPRELQAIVKRAIEWLELQRERERLVDELKTANMKLRQEYLSLKKEVERTFSFHNIIGQSPQMQKVFNLVEKVMELPTSVLIQGETGTGKELIARLIHFNGSRKNKRFVAQNCGSLPETLLESELFGHLKGSFTGAMFDKKGLFEICNGGTIFLDEIVETSPAMQVRLLRVLQEGEVRPLGGTQPRKVDVRILSATNMDLEKAVREGRFREDLYYRLNTFPILLPPLRDREGDAPLLVEHFIEKHSKRFDKPVKGISKEAMMLLGNYPFPGNVRELENEIERAVTFVEESQVITAEHLSERFTTREIGIDGILESKKDLKSVIEELEKEAIRRVLDKTGGNKSKTARELGLSRLGLKKKMARYGIVS